MNANQTTPFNALSTDADCRCETLCMGGALAGSILGSVAGTMASGVFFAGGYGIALTVFGALSGMLGLAMLAYAFAPASRGEPLKR